MTIDISKQFREMLSTNRVLDRGQSAPNYEITATLDGAKISAVLTFLHGRSYCCDSWACGIPLRPGNRWEKLRGILEAHGIALPEQLDLSISVVVEEGALFFDFDKPNPPRQGLEYSLAPVAASKYDDFTVEADCEPPMLLRHREGLSFSLKAHFFRFQYAERELPLCDRDRPGANAEKGRPLVTTILLTTPQGEWRDSGPQISTFELGDLASWLETVARGEPSGVGFDFEEPGLDFSVSESLDVLNVHLSGGLAPDWADDRSLTISFPLVGLNLNQAVSALRSQLLRFVTRPTPTGYTFYDPESVKGE